MKNELPAFIKNSIFWLEQNDYIDNCEKVFNNVIDIKNNPNGSFSILFTKKINKMMNSAWKKAFEDNCK